MPTWLRRSLIAVVVVVVVLVLAVVAFVASFDANRYKAPLIDWVREHKQRTLTIDGPITLSVFPRLSLGLQGVRLSEHQRPEDFASLQEARLSVQVLPLLRKQLAVDTVTARGVRLSYRRDAAGRSNIDDLLAPQAPAAQAPASASGATPQFDISGVALDDVQATVDDAKLGIVGRFDLEHLTTGRLASGVESPVGVRGRATLTKPAVTAQIDLQTQLRLDLPANAAASIGLKDLQLAVQGDGFDVKGLDAKLKGRSFAYDGSSGALSGEALQLTLTGTRLGLALKDSSIGLASLRFEPDKRALQFGSLAVKIAGRSGERDIAASLDWPRLEVTGDQLKGAALQGSGSVKGEPSLSIDFSSRAPSGSFERITVPAFKVAVEGAGSGRTLRGQAMADVTVSPKPLAIALDALNATLALTDPAIAPLNLALVGTAKASAADASWALTGSANAQKLEVSGRADLSRPVPKVDVRANFVGLDLSHFMKPAANDAADAKPATGAKPAADAPVDLRPLKAIDGSLSLHAGSLVLPPYRINDAVVEATLAGGALRVSQLDGRAWGGRFDGQASADATTQRVGIKLDATDVDIRALLSDVAKFDKVEGRGRVSAHITSHGATVSQLKQQLAGKAAVQLHDGAVRGVNLARLMRQWKAAVSLNQDAVQASRTDEKTDFSAITASFDIANGVARSNDLDAKSPLLRAGGDGAIDIGKSHIDYLLKATVANTTEGQGGADLAMLKGVTVPVQLVGPFDAISYRVQWSAVSAELLKKRVGGALGEALGGVGSGAGGGSAKDLLKGILRPGTAASAPAGAASSQKDQLKDSLKKLFPR